MKILLFKLNPVRKDTEHWTQFLGLCPMTEARLCTKLEGLSPEACLRIFCRKYNLPQKQNEMLDFSWRLLKRQMRFRFLFSNNFYFDIDFWLCCVFDPARALL